MKEFILTIWITLVEFFSMNIVKFIAKSILITIFLFLSLNIIIKTETLQQEVVQVQIQNMQLYEAQNKLFSAAYNVNIYALQMIEVLKTQLDNVIEIQDNKVIDLTNNIHNTLTQVQEELEARDNLLASVLVRETSKPSYEYLKNITVLLIQRLVTDETQGSLGTGVVIKVTDDATYIVTNNHVCDWAEGTVCYVKEGDSEYPITSVKKSSFDDVQIVKVAGKIVGKEAVRGIKDSKQQDKVFMVGHNLGNPFLYAEGTVAGYQRQTNILIVGMPSGPGNSGSGIITQDGYLTGLLFAGQVLPVLLATEGGEGVNLPLGTMDTSHGLCVNTDVLKLFLADYLK